MTRILIADDHELVRQGLRKVLEAQSGWVICGEAADGRTAVAMTLELKPDVLVLDFTMPELNGLEVTRRVRAARLPTEVLILTMHESEQLAHAAMTAGALGFVLKSDAGTTLVTVVEHLRRHQPFFSAKVSHRALDGDLGAGGGPPERKSRQATGSRRASAKSYSSSRRVAVPSRWRTPWTSASRRWRPTASTSCASWQFTPSANSSATPSARRSPPLSVTKDLRMRLATQEQFFAIFGGIGGAGLGTAPLGAPCL